MNAATSHGVGACERLRGGATSRSPAIKYISPYLSRLLFGCGSEGIGCVNNKMSAILQGVVARELLGIT